MFLEQRIRVDDADQRMPRRVDARVHRVRLAAVHLVDQHEIPVRQRSIHRAHFLRGDRLLMAHHRAHHLERFGRGGDGAILRSIVDDDDLVFRVVQEQERAQALADRGFLVVRGDDQRDRGRRGRAHHDVEIARGPAAAMAAQLEEADDREQQIQAVQGEEIHRRRDAERHEDDADGIGQHGQSRSWTQELSFPQHLPRQVAGLIRRVRARLQLGVPARPEAAKARGAVRGDEPVVVQMFRKIRARLLDGRCGPARAPPCRARSRPRSSRPRSAK